MRSEEAVTYLDFMRQPWVDVVASGSPDNHVLHTVLARAASGLAGGAPWALRLPAFAAGILTILATYAVARALYSGRAALVAALFVATSGMFVLYATTARGYTLVTLAFVLLLLAAIKALDGDDSALGPAFIVIGALGLWTTPVMLYPLGAIGLWLLFNALVANRPGLARRVVLTLASTVVLALVLYAPIIARDGFSPILSELTGPRGWFEFFQALPGSVASAIGSWSLGVPMLSVALVLLAALSMRRAPSRFAVGFGLAAFAWCSWLLLLSHHAPLPRVWLWLYPVIAISAAQEIVAVLEGRERTRALVDAHGGRFAAVFALILAVTVVTTRAVPRSRETGTFRDAQAMAEQLAPNLMPSDVVLAAPPSNAPLSFYFRRSGLTPPRTPLDSARRVFVIVDVAEGQTLDRLTDGSIVRDTARFTQPRVVGTFTTSGIFLYLRRGSSR
jgi:4-amino-4-deoxy-L-arabinose transferase-like glycosyltransferase